VADLGIRWRRKNKGLPLEVRGSSISWKKGLPLRGNSISWKKGLPLRGNGVWELGLHVRASVLGLHVRASAAMPFDDLVRDVIVAILDAMPFAIIVAIIVAILELVRVRVLSVAMPLVDLSLAATAGDAGDPKHAMAPHPLEVQFAAVAAVRPGDGRQDVAPAQAKARVRQNPVVKIVNAHPGCGGPPISTVGEAAI
jgi:hypothetical protein